MMQFIPAARCLCACLALALLPGTALLPCTAAAQGEDLSSARVLKAIKDGTEFLIRQQNADGSWSMGGGGARVGVSSLAVLTLINSGLTPLDPPVRRGLEYLRGTNDNVLVGLGSETYETSLLVMALAAAKEPRRDGPRLLSLTIRLENGQLDGGDNAGSWDYSLRGGGLGGGDRSNGQFAVLALREAAYAGIPVSRQTWERAARHWLAAQNGDGGWGYSGTHKGHSYGSMTVAGLSTLAIVKTMLKDDDLKPDGTPDCCGRDRVEDQLDAALERGARWLASHFAVSHNPGENQWLLYYLYGLERAGRLTGRRFFGAHDWYREGAAYLVKGQTVRDGGWRGVGGTENDATLGTCFALLFLSKGLSPVLINKLKYGPPQPGRPDEIQGDDWKLHPDDARNLTERVSGLPKWPKLVTWQVLDLPKVRQSGSVADLLQAPVLFITGRDAPNFSAEEATLLRDYIDGGGFIFAAAGCNKARFEEGMRNLVVQMYPKGEADLLRLGADHPVYVAEYLLDAQAVELYGVDVGCRTALVYSPDDLGCLWERWLPYNPPGRPAPLVAMIEQKMRVGVNVVAYATGREPPSKLDVAADLPDDGQEDKIERGLLQIAKLRHSGAWDAAPRALRNLLLALNRTGAVPASTQAPGIAPTDADLYKYPIVYMHGRNGFSLSPKEIARLREHLDRGAVLFADACCGAPAFDEGFRKLVKQLYPDSELTKLPPEHELFTAAVGNDLSGVRRRAPGTGNGRPLDAEMITGEPYLEALEHDGRLSVIYSKYDISCALEKQSSAACAGYLPEDAVKIAINIIRYAMLQDI